MKRRILTTEAQAICRVAAEKAFENIAKLIEDMEQNQMLREEATMTLKNYNAGYMIEINAAFDWNHTKFDQLPGLFYNPHVQPNTFFEEYMEEGKGARLEGSYLFGSSDQKDVNALYTFQDAANEWLNKVIDQVNEYRVKLELDEFPA